MRRTLSRRRLLLYGAAALAVPAVAGSTTAPVGDGRARLRLLRHAYAGDPSASGTDRWDVQLIQGDRARPSAQLVTEQFVYATAVRRISDPAGVTQCLRPADVPDSWLLRDVSGRLIQRFDGDDTAIDIGLPEFRRASADFLVAKCRDGGRQPWSGVGHDEFNAEFGWGWDGVVPARYPDTGSWQRAVTEYVAHLDDRLRGAGFDLVGNLGAATDDKYDDFFMTLRRRGMVPSLEYFVCGRYRPDDSTANYADPAEWLRQVRLIGRFEDPGGGAAGRTAAGVRLIVHERQTGERAIRYSLASYLLGSSGDGASVYGADVSYDARTTPYPRCFDDARRLGAPIEPMTPLPGDTWSRRFAGGSVVVNAGGATTTYRGRTIEAHDAVIDAA